MPHFHVDKTEYLYVQRGAVRLRLGNEIRMIDQSVGEVKIARWTPHRWEVLGEAETTVFERTEPRDGRKQGFFRNFVSLCNDYGGLDKIPPLQVFKTFAEWDNYPIGNAAWMASMRSAIVGITWAVGGIAGLCGYRAVYKEYMPPDLYEKLK